MVERDGVGGRYRGERNENGMEMENEDMPIKK